MKSEKIYASRRLHDGGLLEVEGFRETGRYFVKRVVYRGVPVRDWHRHETLVYDTLAGLEYRDWE